MQLISCRRMMVSSGLLSIVALLATVTPAAPKACLVGWQPTPDDISNVEASLQMTSIYPMFTSKHNLSRYERYYAAGCLDGHQSIIGVFVLEQKPLGAEIPTFHVVDADELPRIADGGCSVIDFAVDAADLTHGTARCHGYG